MLQGWGWQQGMYDIPCSVSTGQQCAADAAMTFANYTKKHHMDEIPSFPCAETLYPESSSRVSPPHNRPCVDTGT